MASILLIDDDDALRNVMAESLRHNDPRPRVIAISGHSKFSETVYLGDGFVVFPALA